MKIEKDRTIFIFKVCYLKKNAIKQYLFMHPYYIHSCQIFNYFLESPSFDKIRKFTFNNISIIINSWYVNFMRLSVFETKTKWKKQTISSKTDYWKLSFGLNALYEKVLSIYFQFYIALVSTGNFYCIKPQCYVVFLSRTWQRILATQFIILNRMM